MFTYIYPIILMISCVSLICTSKLLAIDRLELYDDYEQDKARQLMFI